MSERIRQRTSADAIAAIERKVSEARLEEAKYWATPFGEKEVTLCESKDNCAECDLKRQRIAQLEAEAAGKET